MEKIHIRTPFYTAGKKYGWSMANVGIGIKLSTLRSNDLIEVTIKDNPIPYFLDCKKAIKFVNDTHSIFYTQDGTSLGIIPIALLDKQRIAKLSEWLT